MRLLIALGMGAVCLAHGQAPVDYARDVAPVFASRCQNCHGGAMQMAGLRLDTGAAALKGGNSGAVIVPGKSAGSKLIERVSSTKKGFAMPPAGPPLSAREIEILKNWVDQGAKTPANEIAASTTRNSHWSYQPIGKPAPPEVKNTAAARTPIDRFVLARLEREGIEPSPEASKGTLIRRLSLDLTGLPPSPEEVKAFLEDESPQAYERVVDRLLASPHYGERWARQWLDLARYADSDGYEKDLVRPTAWRYRQWVIDAFNRDMPFDQFTVEQLAGDLLPSPSPNQLVATGLHRNVLTNREAGVDREEARFEQTVNRTNTFGTVWLGLTVGCAQCHNHKYDPISQKEYYQLFAFFNSMTEAEIDAPLPGERGAWLRERPVYLARRKQILESRGIPELQAEWENKMRAAIATPGKTIEWDFAVTSFKAMVDNAVKLITTDSSKRTERQNEILTDYFLRNNGPDMKRNPAHEACVKEARELIIALQATLSPYTTSMGITEDPRPTYIAQGGDYRSQGAEVTPGTLAVLPPFKGKTRLDLARWVTAKDNPLTPRVVANRAWQELLGRGIVRTSEDFGLQGEKPSHPELLDWLAADFLENGQSLKRLHKTIVMSATYRQSSRIRKELLSKDPENVLLARQSRVRLPAELIRDSALYASGLLNTEVGGRSVRPPQPAGVAELGYANSVKWMESAGAERYKRGLYIHFQRTTPYPMLMNFDAPDSNVACTRRTRTNTPLQALNLLNDPVFVEAAQGLAVRVLRESHGSFGERLDRAFELCLGRKPKPMERERLGKYYDEQLGILRKEGDSSVTKMLPLPPEGADRNEAAAWVGLSRVLLNLDEFITRE